MNGVIRKKFVANLLLGLAFTFVGVGQGYAKQYIINGVPLYPQESLVECGVAVAQAWIAYYGHPMSQSAIALLYFTPKIIVRGVNAGDLEKALELGTGRKFQHHDHTTINSAVKRLKEEIKDEHHPIAISGNACKKNGSPKAPQGHWLMVVGLYLNNKNEFIGAYVNDPLYGSRFDPLNGPWYKKKDRNDYETIRPRTWVRDLFTKWWLPNPKHGRQFRQTVED